MLTWIRKWELLTRPWRWFECRIFHEKWPLILKTGLFFLCMTSVIAVATHLSWFHAWSKYIKKNPVTVLFSCFWWYYSSLLRLPMPLSCSLELMHFYSHKVNAFQNHESEVGHLLGKCFLSKPLNMQAYSAKKCYLFQSLGCVFHVTCFCVSRGVENWIALKGQAEENWLVLTSAHSSSTRRENFKFWNLLFSY